MSRGEYFQNEDGEWIKVYPIGESESSPAWVRPTPKQMESLQAGLWRMSKEDLHKLITLVEKYGE